MQKLVNHIWYGRSKVLAYLLLPLSFLFRCVVSVRRWLYQKEFLKSTRVSTPVIIVGNLTVGGTGKTPFVIFLVELLKKQHNR